MHCYYICKPTLARGPQTGVVSVERWIYDDSTKKFVKGGRVLSNRACVIEGVVCKEVWAHQQKSTFLLRVSLDKESRRSLSYLVHTITAGHLHSQYSMF